MLIYLSTLLMSLFVTMALIPIMIRVALRIRLVDVPDARKVHTTPIPRCGGIAIAMGTCLPIFFWQQHGGFMSAYLTGVGVLVATGMVDDYRGLDYRVKLACQILAAVVMTVSGGVRILSLGAVLPDEMLLPDWLTVPLTVLSIVAVTNAINLSDGLDGLAGGLCLISLCCIGYLAYLVENSVVLFLSLSLAGAIFGFLRFNSFPASLFMGDTGSMFLGFSVVSLALAVTQGSSPFSPWLPLVISGMPVMDTVAVMAARMASGKSPFKADKNHFHHKLLRTGLYHSEAVMVIYVLQCMMISFAMFFRFHGEGVLLIGYAIFFSIVLMIFIFADHFHWRFERTGFVDRLIKGRLRSWKERGYFIKVASRGLEYGLPMLLIVTCCIPLSYPDYLRGLSAILLTGLTIVSVLRRSWRQSVLILTLYLFIPFVVYTSTDVGTNDDWIEMIVRGASLFMVFFVLATLKWTKRRTGFKISPSDFLILFIALLAPLIAGTWIAEKKLAEMTVKTLVFFFSYEVLIGELRGKVDRLSVATGLSLLIIILKG